MQNVKTWVYFVGISIIGILTIGLLNVFGLFVDDAIFTNSFQYRKARELEKNTYRVELEAVKTKLANPNLDPQVRLNLEAQKTRLENQIQISDR